MATIKRLKENKYSLKIAIFSGGIPSSTFIEHLIEGVSRQHQVLLFGVVENKKNPEEHLQYVYRRPKLCIAAFTGSQPVLHALLGRFLPRLEAMAVCRHGFFSAPSTPLGCFRDACSF